MNEIEKTPFGDENIRHSIEKSKIVDYGLAEQVIKMFFEEGFRYSTIMAKCNQILKERGDGKPYIPINYMNVKQFISTAQKEVDKYPSAPLAKKMIDVVGELESVKEIIKTEIDKLRTVDGPMLESRSQTFLRLLKELNRTLELTANVQGKAQPSITFNVFKYNVDSFCDKVINCKELSEDAKGVILAWAADVLITDNLLKSAHPAPTDTERKLNG